MASASHVVNNKEKEVGGDKHPRSLRGSDAKYDDYDDTRPDYSEAPWKIISSYFEDQHLKRLVRHQIESYNDFVNVQIERTIGMFNPVMIASEQDFDKKYFIFSRSFLTKNRLFASINNEITSRIIRALPRLDVIDVRILVQNANGRFQHDWHLANVNIRQHLVKRLNIFKLFS